MRPRVSRKKQKSIEELIRDLCPKDGSGITSVTISSRGHEPITLTKETRKKMDELLKLRGR